MSEEPLVCLLWGSVFKLTHHKYYAEVACGEQGVYLCVGGWRFSLFQ